MPYTRTLWIEGRRLVPQHSLFEEIITESYCAGVTCNCCEGYFRFRTSRTVKARLSVPARRYKWYRKRFPKLWRNQYEAEARRCELTGREDPDWWRDFLK